MKKINRILILLIAVLFGLIIIGNFTNVKADSTNVITNIFTNPGEDSNTEMGIVYHLPIDATGSYIYYTEKSDTKWVKQIKVLPTKEENNDAFIQLNAIGSTFKKVSINLVGLKPGTEYMYKVVYGENVSNVHYFKTGSQYFSFIWTSDFHAYYSSASRLKCASNNIQECLNINAGADFILSTGDTIAHGGTYEWWTQLAGASWIQNYMLADTLGNHDWMTKTGTTIADGASHIFWGANHNNPKNGYTNNENICYYFYYGDAIFICLNTEEFTQAQYNWCEEVLKNCDAQYKFIFQHYQMISPNGAFGSTGYKRWKKLCDTYGVDVAFSGNSHVYVRTTSIYNDAKSSNSSQGTVYMVAPSSDGERGENPYSITTNKNLIEKNWAGGSKQCANSIVNVTEEGIRVRLINQGGEVLDEALIPAKRGSSSRISKNLTDVDKDAVVDKVELKFENNDYSKPYLLYGENAKGVVRSFEVINKDTNEAYYNNIDLKSTKVLLTGLPLKQKINLMIKVNFYDNDVQTIDLKEVLTGKEYGSLSNITTNNTKDKSMKISWNNQLVSSEVGYIQVLLNDIQIEKIDASLIEYAILYKKFKSQSNNIITLNVYSATDCLYEQYQIDYTAPTFAESVEIKCTGNNEIEGGEKTYLKFNVNPIDAIDPFVWSSDNTDVAKVNDDGVVVGISFGVAVIQCKSKINSKLYAEYTITVLSEGPSEKLVIQPIETGEYKIGQNIQMNMLTTEFDDQYIWTSSNPTIASVDENGVVTTYKAGTVKISCASTTQDDVVAVYDLTIESNSNPVVIIIIAIIGVVLIGGVVVFVVFKKNKH